MSEDVIKVAYARFPDCGNARYGFLEGVRHAADRIEALEAALRDVIILTESEEVGSARDVIDVARTALAPEQEK